MVAEFGHFALILALLVSLVQATAPMIGAQRQDPVLMQLARPAAASLLLLCLIAFAALIWAYVTSDFSVINVYQNSHSAKPLLYKISGVWGNHEGSMLLWVTILALFGCAVALFGRNLPPSLRARTLAVQGGLAFCFLLFILLTSNPFDRLSPAPMDGRDLNPILQDPALAIHPPMLYLGYVGFSIAFSFAIAALIEGRVDASWARWVRPWTLAAWLFLTGGIALGSWWAYYELGWGGWWYWDPVENASFMPWLAGTALLHSAIVVEKREALKSWTILLAIMAFALSLIGTFLVRSGILTSVHAFAVDPERGTFILVLLLLVIGGSFALYAWRAPDLKAGGLFQPISREGSLLLNNLLLSVATATVFVGTLYPLFLEAVTSNGDKVSVGPPYYNATFVPIMVPLILAMSAGPLMSWKRSDLRGALQRLWPATLASLAVVILVAGFGQDDEGVSLAGLKISFAAMGFGLACWLIMGSVVEYVERIGLFRKSARDSLKRAISLPRSAWGMTFAHLGLGVAILGMVGSTLWKDEQVLIMYKGDQVSFSGFDITFQGVEDDPGPNYSARRGTFEIRSDGELATELKPAKRFYPVQQMPTTESAIYPHGLSDLYITMGDEHEDGGWTVRLFGFPLVGCLWLGCALMTLGGLISLSDRRLRVGAPGRKKQPSGQTARPAAATS